MAMTFELWRLVEVKDERRSTCELVGRFNAPRRARAKVFELAGPHVVSSDEETISYQDASGDHVFRIEAVPDATSPESPASASGS